MRQILLLYIGLLLTSLTRANEPPGPPPSPKYSGNVQILAEHLDEELLSLEAKSYFKKANAELKSQWKAIIGDRKASESEVYPVGLQMDVVPTGKTVNIYYIDTDQNFKGSIAALKILDSFNFGKWSVAMEKELGDARHIAIYFYY